MTTQINDRTSHLPRPRVKFSIRFALFITLVSSVGFAWYVTYRTRATREVAAISRIAEIDGIICRAWFLDDFQREMRMNNPVSPPGPAWLRHLVGQHAFDRRHTIVIHGDNLNDCFAELDSLSGLKRMQLRRCRFLKSLSGIRGSEIESLELQSFKNLTTLAGIDSLTSLRWLQIDQCNALVDLTAISDLPKLERVVIRNCGLITNEVFEYLESKVAAVNFVFDD